jgi:ribose/xylose/arabinose/galactoside ABC-type transport system permease subunit
MQAVDKTAKGRRGLAAALRKVVQAREFGILAFLVLTIAVIGIARPNFLAPENLLNMGRQMSQTAILAVAMTFLITSAEMDLSVGSIFGFCTLGMALLAKNFGINLWLALPISLLAAAVIGFINGTIVTRGNIPAFIVTLGTLYIIRGVTLLMSPWPVSGIENPSFYKVFAGDIAGIPVQIFWMLGIVALGHIVLNRTRFGYYVRATGSNRIAAGLAGVSVRRIKVLGFMLTAIAAAFAGTLSFAHLTSISPTAGGGLELQVIAAVVIGGTALFGGEGTILGTLLGAALLTIVRNGLVQLGGEGRLQEAFLGAIIILAVWIHTRLRAKGGSASL